LQKAVVSKYVRSFLVGALNVQTQGAAAQLINHKRFQRSFELSEGEGDVRSLKLFRQNVPPRWLVAVGGGKTAVTKLVA